MSKEEEGEKGEKGTLPFSDREKGNVPFSPPFSSLLIGAAAVSP